MGQMWGLESSEKLTSSCVAPSSCIQPAPPCCLAGAAQCIKHNQLLRMHTLTVCLNLHGHLSLSSHSQVAYAPLASSVNLYLFLHAACVLASVLTLRVDLAAACRDTLLLAARFVESSAAQVEARHQGAQQGAQQAQQGAQQGESTPSDADMVVARAKVRWGHSINIDIGKVSQ